MSTTSLFAESTSRRAFLGRAATLAAGALLAREIPGRALAASASKPNSVIHGVRVGVISYSYRSGPSTAQDILKALIEDGLSEVELMGPAIQEYAGFTVATGGGGKGKKKG